MYNFDEIIDRRHTNAMNTDGFRQYIFHADENMVFPYKDEEFIRMWVADMEFATPDVVIDAIRRRLDRRIFGYTRVSDPGYYEAFSACCRRRYGWDFPKKELVMSNGVIPALFELVEYICKPDEKVLFLTPLLRLLQARRGPQRARLCLLGPHKLRRILQHRLGGPRAPLRR